MRRPGTGCVTCRIRKVKCDEARPSCYKCIKTGRRCDGYSSLPYTGQELRAASQGSGDLLSEQWSFTSSHGWASLERRLISCSTFQTVAEKRYFQFFRHCTVASTSLMVDSRFWDRLVLQSCDAEKAIKHAVLAIAAYHNSIASEIDRPTAQQHLAFAERQYHMALRETNALITSASNRQVERVLMVCVLFILYEGIQGNFAASQAHMTSGRAIAAQSRQGALRNHAREISEVFARLDLFALAFSGAAAPYQYTLEDLLDTTPDLRPSTFADMRHAHSSLIDLIRWMLVLGNHINFGTNSGEELDGVDFKVMLQRCAYRLSEWHEHWHKFIHERADGVRAMHIKLVELSSTAASTICSAGFGGPETRYDPLFDQFVRIVELSEVITSELRNDPSVASFSLDSGYLIPTFFCAIRCRDPSVRRRAVRVLELLPRREGIWQSTGAAAIANRWMQVEEGRVEHVTAAHDIPEDYWVAWLDVRVDYCVSSATLHFTGAAVGRTGRCSRLDALRWSPSR